MNSKQEYLTYKEEKSFEINRYDLNSTCPHIKFHLHNDYEIVFVKNGKGRISVDNCVHDYENGALVFLGPHLPHLGFINREFEDNFELVIHFNEAFVLNRLQVFPEMKAVLSLIQSSNRVLIFNNELKNKLAYIFESIHDQNPTEQLLSVLRIFLEMCEIDNHTKLLLEKYRMDYQHSERFKSILDYINENYERKISTNDIASHLNLTPNSFCRVFKQISNKGFMDYLNEFRINNATYLLEWGSLTVSEIMFKSGFTNPSYFTKQFRKYKNLSPSDYRKRLREEQIKKN
ncbi:helix-turn-helix domain-containing protein [Ancylomarina sp. YFZ004]